MAFDPTDNVFIVANDVDSPPYLTMISVSATPSSDAIVGQLKFPGSTGIEQTVFDSATDLFYSNVVGIGLAVIDPKTHALVTTYPETGCTASG